MVLRLPRVTGWGTDAIANAATKLSMMKQRQNFLERGAFVRAIRDQASKGAATEESFSVLDRIAPGVSSGARKMQELVQKKQEVDKLHKTLQVENLATESINKLIDKGRKYAESPNGKDAASRQFETANKYGRKVFGDSWSPVSITTDPAIMKREGELAYVNKVNENMTKIEQMFQQGFQVQGLISEMRNTLNKGESLYKDSMKTEFARLGKLETAIKEKATQAQQQKDKTLAFNRQKQLVTHGATEQATKGFKPTDFENTYNELKKLPGYEKLTRLDLKKELKKKNVVQAAVSLAQKDISVMSGRKTLGQATGEILNVLKQFSGEGSNQTTELPKGLTESMIKFYEAKHGMKRNDIIQRYKTKKGIK